MSPFNSFGRFGTFTFDLPFMSPFIGYGKVELSKATQQHYYDPTQDPHHINVELWWHFVPQAYKKGIRSIVAEMRPRYANNDGSKETLQRFREELHTLIFAKLERMDPVEDYADEPAP